MRPLAQLALVVVSLTLPAAGVEAQIINACVMKNGLLKVVDDESDCRPRETPITLNETQPAAETARVFDGEGRDVGVFLELEWIQPIRGFPVVDPVRWRVLLADVGVIGILNPNSGSIGISIPIKFTDLDCEGRGFVSANWSNTLFSDPRDGSWLIGSTTEFLSSSAIGRSTLHTDGSCENPRPGISTSVIFIEAFDQELGLTFPLPLPMWIGSSSDSP